MSSQNPKERTSEKSVSLSKTGNLIYIPAKPKQSKDKRYMERDISPQLPPRYTPETLPFYDAHEDTALNYIYDGDIEMMPDSDSESIYLGEQPIEISPNEKVWSGDNMSEEE